MRSARSLSALVHTLGSLPRRQYATRSALAISALAVGGAEPVLADSTLPKTGDGKGGNGYMKFCDEETMSQKAHGTSESPVQKELRWNVDRDTADRICNFNRHYAEHAGYYKMSKFLEQVDREKPTVYYDSVTGLPLFVAPIGRSMESFLSESDTHGWPSFRDQEVVWENFRVLKASGEAVSRTGTHLGHNLPDKKGNRYCINLVSVAGRPLDADEKDEV